MNASMINDWAIFGASVLVMIALTAFSSMSEEVKKKAMLSGISTAKTIWDRALRILPYVAFGVLAWSLLSLFWRVSEFGFILVFLAVVVFAWSRIERRALRHWEFSINAHQDFVAWHRAHFALFEEILGSGVLTEDGKRRVMEELDRMKDRKQIGL